MAAAKVHMSSLVAQEEDQTLQVPQIHTQMHLSAGCFRRAGLQASPRCILSVLVASDTLSNGQKCQVIQNCGAHGEFKT